MAFSENATAHAKSSPFNVAPAPNPASSRRVPDVSTASSPRPRSARLKAKKDAGFHFAWETSPKSPNRGKGGKKYLDEDVGSTVAKRIRSPSQAEPAREQPSKRTKAADEPAQPQPLPPPPPAAAAAAAAFSAGGGGGGGGGGAGWGVFGPGKENHVTLALLNSAPVPVVKEGPAQPLLHPMLPAPPTAAVLPGAGMVGPGPGHSNLKLTAEERKQNKFKRQEEVLQAIGSGRVTEKRILDQVGDSRYTREILRRLLAQGVVERIGKGGSNDPFLYTVVASMLQADGTSLQTGNLVDPGLEVRLRRIEGKIMALLLRERGYTTEKLIRLQVGDNTGTGKALRRLVQSGRVARQGKGGVGDPYRYKCSDEEEALHPLGPDPTPLPGVTAPAPTPSAPALAAAARCVAIKTEEEEEEEEGREGEGEDEEVPSPPASPMAVGDEEPLAEEPLAVGVEEPRSLSPALRRKGHRPAEAGRGGEGGGGRGGAGARHSFSPKWARKYARPVCDASQNSPVGAGAGALDESGGSPKLGGAGGGGGGGWFGGGEGELGAGDEQETHLGELSSALGIPVGMQEDDDSASVHSSSASSDLQGPMDSDRSASPHEASPFGAVPLQPQGSRHTAALLASPGGEIVQGKGPEAGDRLLAALFSSDAAHVAASFLA